MAFLFGPPDELKDILRVLWKAHVQLTRNVILGLAQRADVTFDEAELLKNQDDIGATFRQRYGDHVATTVANLLKEHIRIAGALITAARDAQEDDVVVQKKLWFKNANDIAVALAQLNPIWKVEKLRAALYAHLELTLQEAVSELRGNRSRGIRYYLSALQQVNQIADALALGLLQTIALHGQHLLIGLW